MLVVVPSGIGVAVWYGTVLREIGMEDWMEVLGEGLVVLSILVGIGIFGYKTLADILNTTIIRHAPGVLEIAHHPLRRSFGGGRWKTGTFISLQLKAVRVDKGFNFMATRTDKGAVSYRYRLMAARSDGRASVELLSKGDYDLIRFLAHELAAAMQLPLETKP